MNIHEFLKEQEVKYFNSFQSIAKMVMKDYVIPFCNLNGLKFVSGNGTYAFIKSNGKTYDEHTDKINGMDEILQLLSLNAINGEQLGTFMIDYNGEDQDDGPAP